MRTQDAIRRAAEDGTLQRYLAQQQSPNATRQETATPGSTPVNTESISMRPWEDAGHAAKLAVHVLADCLAVSLIVWFAFYLLTGQMLTEQLRLILVQVWLYAIPIATAAHVILPPIHPFVAGRRPIVQWSVLIVTLAVIGVAGSASRKRARAVPESSSRH